MIDESIYFVRGLPCKKEIWRELIFAIGQIFYFCRRSFCRLCKPKISDRSLFLCYSEIKENIQGFLCNSNMLSSPNDAPLSHTADKILGTLETMFHQVLLYSTILSK